jgi:hypothetical protein
MSISLPCPRCDKVITAEDEDDLVAQVQDHVARDHDDHGLPKVLPRKHILARLRRHRDDGPKGH